MKLTEPMRMVFALIVGGATVRKYNIGGRMSYSTSRRSFTPSGRALVSRGLIEGVRGSEVYSVMRLTEKGRAYAKETGVDFVTQAPFTPSLLDIEGEGK